MSVIIIHALWWLFGFTCGFVVMGALALSSELSRMEDTPIVMEDDEPEPVMVERIELDEKTAQMVETAKFYQELFAEEMMRNSGIKLK